MTRLTLKNPKSWKSIASRSTWPWEFYNVRFSYNVNLKFLNKNLNLLYWKGILLTIANYFQVIMFIKGATYLHNKLLNSILRSTMHFFESTPIGRIINRFSKDVEATESYIPDSFKICVFCLSNILNTLIIVTYSTPYVLVFLVPIFIVYTFVQVSANFFSFWKI